MADLAIVAALPREVRGLAGKAPADATLERQGIFLVRLPGAVVVAGGMGTERVTLAVEAAMRLLPQVGTLVSVGLAGACSPALKPGVVAEVSHVIDARTGERYATGHEGVVLTTTDTIASVREKQRLMAAYGATLVDMEAAAVARLARARGLRFRAVKGVSDAHDFELAGLGKFTGPRGEFRTAAFALHTALRPWTWGDAVTLGKHSSRALAALTDRLQQILAGA